MLAATNSIVWQEGLGDTLAEAFVNLFEEAVSWVPQLSAALTVFAIFLIIGLIVRRTMKTMLGRVTRVAPRIRILILRMVFGVILAVGGLAFLGVLTGASLGSVIAGLGLLSVGLGFALKSPLENILSGILTILFAPFRIGDEIEVNGYAGKVETIRVHDTIIRTFDGKRVAVPNVDVYLNAITNQTAYPQRRYDVVVGIHYNDDLPKAVKLARETLASTEGVRPSPEPLVLVSELGESSVDLIVRFWSDPTMQNQFQVISDVTTNVKLTFDREGITIPFPIRTLHIPKGEAKGAGELQVRMTDKATNSDGCGTARD